MNRHRGARTAPTKRERIEARVSAEQKALLRRAANLQGRSLSDFIIDSAQRAAEEIIHEHTVITLTEQDSDAFIEALLHPPAPHEQLRAAAARSEARYFAASEARCSHRLTA